MAHLFSESLSLEALQEAQRGSQDLFRARNTLKQTLLFAVASAVHLSDDQAVECAEFLVDEIGINVLDRDDNNQTALFYAVSLCEGRRKNPWPKTVDFLCRRSEELRPGSVDDTDREKQTPLWYAASAGHVDTCRALVEHKADVTLLDRNRETPIFYAAMKAEHPGHLDVIKFLVERGTNPSAQNKWKQVAASPSNLKKGKPEYQAIYHYLESHRKRTDTDAGFHRGGARKKYVLVQVDPNKPESTWPCDDEAYARFEKKFPHLAHWPKSDAPEVPSARKARPQGEIPAWEGPAKTRFDQLKGHADAWPFKKPVDPVKLGIPTYFQVITRPMDFETIGTKLRKHEYDGVTDLDADVRLVFSNAMLFNKPGEKVYNCADALQRLWDQWYDLALKKYEPAGSDAP